MRQRIYSKRQRLFTGALAAVLVLASAHHARAGSSVREYQIKAALLYNFAKFVEFPAGADTEPFTLCVLGTDPFGPAIDAINGKRVKGRSVAVERLSGGTIDVARCQILFVGASEEGRVGELAAPGTGVLTVSELDGFAASGGMIWLGVQHNKPKIRINLQATKDAGLKVSSQLLQAAEVL